MYYYYYVSARVLLATIARCTYTHARVASRLVGRGAQTRSDDLEPAVARSSRNGPNANRRHESNENAPKITIIIASVAIGRTYVPGTNCSRDGWSAREVGALGSERASVCVYVL